MRTLAWIILLAGVLSGCAQMDRARDPESSALDPMAFQQVSAIAAVGNLYLRAREQWLAGNIDQAETSLERALRLEPTNGYLWLGLAQLAKEEYHYERARELGFRAKSFTAEDRQLKEAVNSFLTSLAP